MCCLNIKIAHVGGTGLWNLDYKKKRQFKIMSKKEKHRSHTLAPNSA